MNELFRAVSERLKIVFTAHAALDIEAEMVARNIERKAALLRQAIQLEKEGFTDLASELRQAAGRMDLHRPAESVMPILNAQALTDTSGGALLAPTPEKNGNGAGTDRPVEPIGRKKTR